jgi:hypothetical protein
MARRARGSILKLKGATMDPLVFTIIIALLFASGLGLSFAR